MSNCPGFLSPCRMKPPCVLLLMLLMPTVSAGGDDLVVTLKHGRIRGGYVTVKGTDRRVKQYLGIPFARPPVGPLRLAPPQEAEPWEGERNCTRPPPRCIQDPEKFKSSVWVTHTPGPMSEDCLYLNVYTPATPERPGDKLPVMVWVHGGALVKGSASKYDGAPLAAYENLVVVIIQYRLGILGFLSTGDKHARGNWGFLDQVAALRWVQGNVEAFGGDPQTVTVAGESAGGISASMLTLSPLAVGLFNRSVQQSGVATFDVFVSPGPPVDLQAVADLFACPHSGSEELIGCIRRKSEEELLTATKQMLAFVGPVVDGEFLTDSAVELLRRKEVLKVPVMLGVTNHEFGWILPQTILPPGWHKGVSRQGAVELLNNFRNHSDSLVNNVLLDKYLKEAQTPEDIRDSVCNMFGDLLMTLPVAMTAGYLSDAGVPVYLYEFAYLSAIQKVNRPQFVKTDHADDVPFMFGGCFWDGPVQILGNVTEEDQRFCRTIMAYWANFVRDGSPDGPGLVRWPRYQRDQQAYMELDAAPTVKHHLKKEWVQFASNTLPEGGQLLHVAAGTAGLGLTLVLLVPTSLHLAWILIQI